MKKKGGDVVKLEAVKKKVFSISIEVPHGTVILKANKRKDLTISACLYMLKCADDYIFNIVAVQDD